MRPELSAIKRASALPVVQVSRSLRLRDAKASPLHYLFCLPHLIPPKQINRTRRAAEPSARYATGTTNTVQVFEKSELPWRCRESNPGPSGPFQVFSERSLLCFSQPRRSRRQDADGLSHCLIS